MKFESGMEALSEAGLARRQAMLRELKDAVAARRRRRGIGQTAAAAATGLVLAGLVLSFAGIGNRGRGTLKDLSDRTPSSDLRRVPYLRHFHLELVSTDPGVLARFAAPSRPVPPEYLADDEQLLDLLAAAGRPTGLIRVEGRVFLEEDL